MVGGVAAALFNKSIQDAALSADAGSRGLLLSAAILFIWYLGSQMVLAPSGTISVVIGGMIIGPLAGVLYYIAMLGAGVAVHMLARPEPGQSERLIRTLAPRHAWRRFARRTLQRVRRAPLAATAALRLVPILPSAGCALALTAAGAPLRSVMLGTLAAGWVRPVSFAVFSHEVWLALQSRSLSPEALAVNPILWISGFCLVAPAAIVLASEKLVRTPR